MKVTKKILSFLAAVAVSVAVFGTSDAQAEEMKNIATNTVVTDSLETVDDANYYVFTVDKSGYMALEFTKLDPTADAKWGWDVEIYNMNGECLHKYHDYKTSFSTVKYNYKAGTRLYAKVCPANAAEWSTPIGVKYSLKIVTTVNAAWEQEPSDAISAATLLNSGKTRYGHLIHYADADYYVYTMDRTGYFVFDFEKINLNEDGKQGWDIILYNSQGAKLFSYTDWKTGFTSHKFNFKKGTKIYLKVCASEVAEWAAPTFVDYALTIKSTAKSNWEIESLKDASDTWNSRTKSVSTLTKKVRYGSLWYYGDNDVYKISVPKNGAVTLKFNPNNVETNLKDGYNLQIFNKKGQCAAEYRDIKSNSGIKFNAKKGTYYVVVKAQWESAAPPFTDTYSISATSKAFTVPSMKSKKITWKTSSDTLKWKKAKSVDGYEIQVCTNKKFRKSATDVFMTEKTSYTLPWYWNDGTYYVRIRAYKELVTGDKLYGKFTKVKKIRMK